MFWASLLPGFFNQDESEIALGIGWVIDLRHPLNRRKIVLGAQCGGYEALPRIGRSWLIDWVG